MTTSKPVTTWLIEYSRSQDSWSGTGCTEYEYETKARKELKEFREKNSHRDDNTRAQTRPCPIWTSDGTWSSYTSAGTKYRLVKIIRMVVDDEA